MTTRSDHGPLSAAPEEEAPDGAAAPEVEALDAQERAILALERRRFKYQGAKERAIRAELGIPVTLYYQRLNALLDAPAAWAAEPALVRRLSEHRDG